MRKLLSLVITPFEAITKHIPLIIKQIIIGICSFLICFNRVIGDNLIWNNSFAVTVGFGIILSLIIAVLMLNKETINSIKIRPLFLICLEVIGLSFLVNGVIYRVVGYIAIFVVFSVVIPLLSLAVGKQGNNIIISVAVGVVVFFAVFLIASFIKSAPITVGVRYASFTANPNWLGMFLNAVVMAIFVLLFNTKNYIVKALLIFGYSIAFWLIKATDSTTTLIAVAVMTVLFVLLEIFRQFKLKIKKAFWGLLAILVMFSVLVPLSSRLVTYVYTDLQTEYLTEKAEREVQKAAGEAANSEASVSEAPAVEAAVTETASDTASQYGSDYETDTFAVSPELQALDSKFSGRLSVWNTFLHETSLLGHKNEMRIFGNADTPIALNAHNAFIQVPYSAGLLAGICYFVFVSASAVLLLIKKFSLEKLSVFIIGVGFLLCSLGEASYLPYIYLPTTLYFIAVGSVITKEAK